MTRGHAGETFSVIDEKASKPTSIDWQQQLTANAALGVKGHENAGSGKWKMAWRERCAGSCLCWCRLLMQVAAFANDGVINVVAGKTKSIKIAKGKPKTIRVDQGFAEIVVGDPEVANITPLTNQSFYVLGHKLGTTGIALFDDNKKLIGSVDVEVTYDTNQLNTAIQQNVPDSDIKRILGQRPDRAVRCGSRQGFSRKGQENCQAIQ